MVIARCMPSCAYSSKSHGDGTGRRRINGRSSFGWFSSNSWGALMCARGAIGGFGLGFYGCCDYLRFILALVYCRCCRCCYRYHRYHRYHRYFSCQRCYRYHKYLRCWRCHNYHSYRCCHPYCRRWKMTFSLQIFCIRFFSEALLVAVKIENALNNWYCIGVCSIPFTNHSKICREPGENEMHTENGVRTHVYVAYEWTIEPGTIVFGYFFYYGGFFFSKKQKNIVHTISNTKEMCIRFVVVHEWTSMDYSL